MLRNPSVKHMSPGLSQRSRCVGSDQCLSPRHWADFRRHTAVEDRMSVCRPVSLLLPPCLHVSTAPAHAFSSRTHLWSSAPIWQCGPAYLFKFESMVNRNWAGRYLPKLVPILFSLPIWHWDKIKCANRPSKMGFAQPAEACRSLPSQVITVPPPPSKHGHNQLHFSKASLPHTKLQLYCCL